jgi:phage terminase small subunit
MQTDIYKNAPALSVDTDQMDTVRLPNGSSVTRKQLAFVKYLFERDFNEAEALVLAGYRAKNVERAISRLMETPAVQAAIYYYIKNRQMQNELTLDKVVDKLWEEAKNEEAENQGARVNALRHLAHMFGGFDSKRHDSNQAVAVHIDFSGEEDDLEEQSTKRVQLEQGAEPSAHEQGEDDEIDRI